MAVVAARAILCWLAAAGVPALALVGASIGARAQTLAVPNPPPKWSPMSDRKEHAGTSKKSCASYGVGFVGIPGTDACVKIGGWVTLQGAVQH